MCVCVASEIVLCIETKKIQDVFLIGGGDLLNC